MFEKSSYYFSLADHLDNRWKQFAITVAGGNGLGNQSGQLNCPYSTSLDDRNQKIYIADCENHRIVEWSLDKNIARIIVGENGPGNRLDQLSYPSDVIIDQQNNDLIIADQKNRRVMRWSRQLNLSSQIVINDVDCARLAMHDDGTLYISDWKHHEVKRWKRGETLGTIVAGENGQGNQLNQLNSPSFLFIDDNHTLYISDRDNHRVMKWMRDANEGIIVAGGNGQGDQLTQLSRPLGLKVDQFGQIYVADRDNHRVMRWREGEKEATVIVGGNGKGLKRNQLSDPFGLSIDNEGHLYVTDCGNHRIQKFERDLIN